MTNDKCPRCGTSPCYVPMLFGRVECSNPECVEYSSERYGILPVPASEPNESPGKNDEDSISTEYEDTGEVTYLWSNYHHDFGDC